MLSTDFYRHFLNFAIRTIFFGGPYGTRTRDLLRDRQASTPTGLTDQISTDEIFQCGYIGFLTFNKPAGLTR